MKNHQKGAAVKVLVVPTEEERQIAMQALAVIEKEGKRKEYDT